MTTSLILMVIAGLCVMVAIFVIVAALTTKEETDGQRTLIRVTREAGRTRIIDEKSTFRQRVLDPILVGLQRIGWQLTPASCTQSRRW